VKNSREKRDEIRSCRKKWAFCPLKASLVRTRIGFRPDVRPLADVCPRRAVRMATIQGPDAPLIYILLCIIFFFYSVSNSFSHFFLLYNLFLWTIKYSLRVLLYFLVFKLIFVIYPLNFILKIMNNIRDITVESVRRITNKN
jgi:hypothetical protein